MGLPKAKANSTPLVTSQYYPVTPKRSGHQPLLVVTTIGASMAPLEAAQLTQHYAVLHLQLNDSATTEALRPYIGHFFYTHLQHHQVDLQRIHFITTHLAHRHGRKLYAGLDFPVAAWAMVGGDALVGANDKIRYFPDNEQLYSKLFAFFSQCYLWQSDLSHYRDRLIAKRTFADLNHFKGSWSVGLDYSRFFMLGDRQEEDTLYQMPRTAGMMTLSGNYWLSNRIYLKASLGLHMRLPGAGGLGGAMGGGFSGGSEIDTSFSSFALVGPGFGIGFVGTNTRFRPLVEVGIESLQYTLINMHIKGDLDNGFDSIERSEKRERVALPTLNATAGFQYRISNRLVLDQRISYRHNGLLDTPVGELLNYRSITASLGLRFLIDIR